jgi:tripartite-type tricarboxylate transporter receptor subunit TctC
VTQASSFGRFAAAAPSGPARAAKGIVLAACLAAAGAACAQTYPVKPVRFLSGQPPGGATDLFARMVAQKLNDTWKQPVIIEHRAGAAGSIAVDLTAKSPPDGHTLLFSTAGQIVMNPHMMKLNTDPVAELAPVAFLVHTCMLLVTHPSVPVKTVRELVALARAQPGRLNFGSGGVGATTHLAAELFKMMSGTQITHVPFKGAGPAVQGVIGGEIDLTFASMPATLHHAQSGRLRAIAITTRKRSPVVPELPTVTESGVPGYEMTSWYGFFGPAAMLKSTIGRIHTDIGRVAAEPEFQERLQREGAEIEPMTPERFAEFIRTDFARWGKVIRANHITAN